MYLLAKELYTNKESRLCCCKLMIQLFIINVKFLVLM